MAGIDPPEGTLTDTGLPGDEAPRSPVSSAPTLQRIGRYVLLEPVGQGGMGVVWSAYDPVLDRRVAIKLVRFAEGDALGSTHRARLVREAQAMARLQHPNVVVVHDAGVHGESAYIAMELVRGKTLTAWLREGAHGLDEILDVFRLAGRGLEAAHGAGLVHRDFKPSNVLIGADGRVCVSDFGVARLRAEAAGLPEAPPGAADAAADDSDARPTLTQAGSVIGTPRYMAPEQLLGQEADARADQFSFCVALHEAVFGRHPFVASERPTLAELREAVAQPPILPTPGERRLARLVPVIARGLARAPVERFATMSELLAALDAARRPRGRRVAALAIAVGLVASLAFVAWRGSRAAAPGCLDAAAPVDGVWSTARRQALATAFAGVKTGDSVDGWRAAEATLDRWATNLRALRIDTCRLARTTSAGVAEVAEARMACLDRRLGELDALLVTLAAPDDTIATYVRSAAYALRQPDGCLGAVQDAPDAALPAARDRDELARARADLARAASLRSLGKPREALALATDVGARVDRLGWPQLVGEAQLEIGLDAQATSQSNLGEISHQRAAWNAEISRDDALRFEAAMGLVRASIDASDYPEAGRRLESARAILSHLGSDPRRRSRFTYQAAFLEYARGNYGTCVELGRVGLAESIAAYGAQHTEIARAHQNLARCLTNLGAFDETGEHLEQALAIALTTVGRAHPMTSDILMNLGILERRRGHHEVALGRYREALAIREAVYGADNPEVAATLNNIANVQRQLGRLDEAKAAVERAVDIWSRAWGDDSPAVGNGNAVLGHIARQRGDLPAAEAHYRRSLAIRRKKRPPGHDEISSTLVNLGGVLLEQRQREAVPVFEEALASYEKDADTDEPTKAEVRMYLGRALHELAIDPPRGRALVAAACPALTGKDWTAEAEACRAWLAAPPRPRPPAPARKSELPPQPPTAITTK